MHSLLVLPIAGLLRGSGGARLSELVRYGGITPPTIWIEPTSSDPARR